jgi:hypothetical protein
MKQLLYTIAAIPALALFGGVGVLAWRIGETWDSATTQSLVTGLTVICGGGALLFAILLACIVGIPLAIRAYGEGGSSRRQWDDGWHSNSRSALPRVDDWPPIPTKRQFPMIEGQWSRMPDPPVAQSSSPPPWGMTGGGNTQLLPPAEQDERFAIHHPE